MIGSRKLSIAEYLKILQLEYLSHRTREILYEDPGFIKMNGDIARKKKEKIKNVSRKFQLLSIFDSQDYFEDFVTSVFYQEFGTPLMQYGVAELKNKAVSHWDKYFLLKPQTIIEFNGMLTPVTRNNPNKEVVDVCINGEIVTLPYTYIKIKKLNIPFE